MLVLALGWVLARDPHAHVVAGLALVLALSIAVSRTWGGPRRLRAIAAVVLAAIAVTSLAAATLPRFNARWTFALQNVLALRISAEPDQLAYFEDAGMPVTPALLAEMEESRRRGRDILAYPPTHDSPLALRNATPFQRWLLAEGRSTYTRFLLTHPGVVDDAFGHLGRGLLDPEVAGFASRASPWTGGPAAAAVYPRRTPLAVAWLAVALGLAAFVGLRFGPRPEWLVPAFLIATSLPFAIFIYHADVELDRHSLMPSVFLRLGALLLVLFAVDRWLQVRRERSQASR
jgi:hypothetical protein